MESQLTKICTKCKMKKLISCFYLWGYSKDGHISQCKECIKIYQKNRRQGPNRQKILDADNNRSNRKDRNEYARIRLKRLRGLGLTSKIKDAAHNAVPRAIKRGILIRPNNCYKCGLKCKPEGHHADYHKKLDVVWLCKRCHKFLHANSKIINHIVVPLI